MSLQNFGVEVKDNKPKEIIDEKLDLNFDDINLALKSEEIERYLPWFLKYKIERFEDLIQTPEIKKIVKYFEEFKGGKSILLVGPPGSGKTTTLNLIGEHYGFEIFEMNASDSRGKRAIEDTLKDAINQRSLFGKQKMILIDEVDGVAGREDRGGIAEIVKLVKDSKYPVVFTANDKESDKIKAIKKVGTFIDFENHSGEVLVGIGRRIFEREKIEFKEEDLEEFVQVRSTTDIRGFINDIQASVSNSKFNNGKDLEIRDYKRKVELLLDKIFFSFPEDSVSSTFNSDVNLDDLFLFLEENSPIVETDKRALAQIFNEISKADVQKGRIIRWQYWRYLVYVNFYLTYSISTEKVSPKKTPYKRNGRILKKWIYGNKVNSLRPRTRVEKSKGVENRFIENLAKSYGRSANRVRKDDLRYFNYIYVNNEIFRKSMIEKFDIEEDVNKTIHELT